MLNLLAADIIDRFYTFMWPMLRISALMLTAPILAQNAINTRLRVLIALALALLVFGSWQLVTLVDFTRAIFQRIPTLFS